MVLPKIRLLRLICVPVYSNASFMFITAQRVGWIQHFIYTFCWCWWLFVVFPVFASKVNAVMNILLHFWSTSAFSFVGYMELQSIVITQCQQSMPRFCKIALSIYILASSAWHFYLFHILDQHLAFPGFLISVILSSCYSFILHLFKAFKCGGCFERFHGIWDFLLYESLFKYLASFIFGLSVISSLVCIESPQGQCFTRRTSKLQKTSYARTENGSRPKSAKVKAPGWSWGQTRCKFPASFSQWSYMGLCFLSPEIMSETL